MTKSTLLLRHRDFALAWTGGLVSLLGTWALWIALPIHVYAVTGSTLATGAVVACVVVPGIVLGSVAGVFVDRWNRKTTLVVGNLLLAAATLPLLLVGESRIWVVYPPVVVLAIVEQFTEPAENAFLPRLVAPEELLEANALNALNNSLARLIGPALGGTLYAVTGLGGVVLVDAASFAIAAALLISVRASGAVAAAGDATAAAARRWRRLAATAAAARRWRRLAREWVDGLAIVRRERAVGVVF